MRKIYSVEVNGIEFFMTEDERNGNINFLFQDLGFASNYLDTGNSKTAYGIVMGNEEVISYGRSLGFIKNKKLIK